MDFSSVSNSLARFSAAIMVLVGLRAFAGSIWVGLGLGRTNLSLASIGLRPSSKRWLVVGLGAGLLAVVLTRGVVLAYIQIVGDAYNPQAALERVATGRTPLDFALLALLGGALGPMVEELLFRGLLYTWLRRWGQLLAIAGSSLVFGLSHGFNVVALVTVLLGMLLAFLYEKSGSLWPSIIAHACYNTSLFLIARFVL